jgi:putative hydrolase of the HAD superfamily
VIHAILFDVDGVLVHPWRFRDALARDHGITPAMTAPFFHGPFLHCAHGRGDLLEALPPFLASWGWRGSAREFVNEWLSVENAPDESVFDVVAKLRRHGIPCFVASTQERHRARYLATTMHFDRLFDGLFFSCDLGTAKPSAAFHERVASRLGRAPSELLLVDDALANVEGARAAGWCAEQFTTADRLRADVARHVGISLDGD